MAADLRGVRRKLERAETKLEALQNEIAAYLDLPPFRFTVETEGHEQKIVTHINKKPEDTWADEIGEIVYQARSALDVLVVQIAIGSGTAEPRGTQFPIFIKERDYRRKGRDGASQRDRSLRGVNESYRRVIDGFQPYHRGREAPKDPLAVLQTVSNTDKHNDAYVCVGTSTTPGFRINRPGLGDYIELGFVGELLPYRLEDGYPIIGLTWNPPPPPAPQDTQVFLEPIEMTPDLGFGSGNETVVLSEIEESVSRVAEIVGVFDERLRKS
jgi:hypothetical protein